MKFGHNDLKLYNRVTFRYSVSLTNSRVVQRLADIPATISQELKTTVSRDSQLLRTR